MVDISDEVTDVEMSNNESSDDKGVIVSEVNVTNAKRPPLPNNKDSSTRVSSVFRVCLSVCTLG